MPYRLSAFADEISTDIQVQMDHLLDNGCNFCAMRGANGKNVMEFEDFQIPMLKSQFFNRKIRFSCIGSPIGKVPITEPFEKELTRFRDVCKRAAAFETKVLRVFSFYIPEGDDPSKHRADVIGRLTSMAEFAKGQGLNLLLENEHGLYADTAERCVDVLKSVNAPNVMMAFDFANFVHVGEDPAAAWPKLKQWVRDFHIKDENAAGQVCVAGQGRGKLPEILKEALSSPSPYMLTLEPHLGKSDGFTTLTGAQCFKAAAEALHKVLADIGAK